MEQKPESLSNKIVIGLSMLTLIGFVIAEYSYERPVVKVYDCTIAEISPDVPVQVKEDCRKNKGLRI